MYVLVYTGINGHPTDFFETLLRSDDENHSNHTEYAMNASANSVHPGTTAAR
jgi:hypothetical protein